MKKHDEIIADNDTLFHCGFDRETLRRTLMEAGFDDIRDSTAAGVTKPMPDGGIESFSIFLMTGRKQRILSNYLVVPLSSPSQGFS